MSPRTRRLRFSAAFSAILTFSTVAYADWTYNPTTRHWYQHTSVGSWSANEAEAVSLGGHLVTINDSAEQQWLNTNFPFGEELWVGLYQDVNAPDYSEPSGGWKWVSGEAPGYLNWASANGEPNNSGGAEGNAAMHNWGVGLWNDYPNQQQLRGIVERSCPPGVECPTVSEWGLMAMVLLTLAAGTMVIMRSRASAE